MVGKGCWNRIYPNHITNYFSSFFFQHRSSAARVLSKMGCGVDDSKLGSSSSAATAASAAAAAYGGTSCRKSQSFFSGIDLLAMSGGGNGATTMTASAATRTTPMQRALEEQEAQVSEKKMTFLYTSSALSDRRSARSSTSRTVR